MRCEPQGEIPEGKAPFFRLPIFNYHGGYLSTSYTATYYELAQRHPEVLRCASPSLCWLPRTLEDLDMHDGRAMCDSSRVVIARNGPRHETPNQQGCTYCRCRA